MASSQRLVRVDLNEQAYSWLRERIVTRQFGPGERLGLQGLADELGVSRSPVHQALTRLVSDGLVTVSRRGYAVRPITTELVRRRARRPPGARDLRRPQRRGRARAGEARRTSASCSPPRSRPSRTSTSPTRPPTWRPNRAFHEAIVDLPGNEVISEMYRRLNVHQLVDRAILGLPSTDAGASTEEHTEIVEAIAAGRRRPRGRRGRGERRDRQAPRRRGGGARRRRPVSAP